MRHGKVLVDNGDYLPSEEQFNIAKVPIEQWVEIPNGDYLVTVYPIARRDNSLPDYVVRFEPVDKPLHMAKSRTPPDLIPLSDTPPTAGKGGSADDIYEPQEAGKPLAETYPLLIALGQTVAVGGAVSVPVANELFQAVESEDKALVNDEGDIYLVLAASDTVPERATLVWVNGWSQLEGESGLLKMRGERLVRITKRADGKPLPIAHVEPVIRPQSELSTEEVKVLQAAFAKYAEQHASDKNKIRAFDRDRIAAITSGKALTTRLMELIPIPAEKRSAVQEASNTERAKELTLLMQVK